MASGVPSIAGGISCTGAICFNSSWNGMGKLALSPPGVREGCGGGLGMIWSSTGVSARFVAEGVEGSSIADGEGASGWGRWLEPCPKSSFLGALDTLGAMGGSGRGPMTF